MAYVTDESGRPEVYVRAFPGQGERWTISTQGGNEPVWSRDGKQLFYRAGESIMAVAVKTSPTFAAGAPQRLFDGPYERSTNFWCNYDASPDGSRFLMVKRVNRTPLPRQINVIVNGLPDAPSAKKK
jgi:serine/threonine-protein kinase